MFAKSQRIHFIGIGGIGMSGIAEILLQLATPSQVRICAAPASLSA